MIQAKTKLTKPDDCLATVELTMTIGEWRRMLAVLNDGAYPSWRVAEAVKAVVNRADAWFSAEEGKDFS